MRSRLSGDKIRLYTPFYAKWAPRDARGRLFYGFPRKETDALLRRFGRRRFSHKESNDFNWQIYVSFDAYRCQCTYDRNTPTKRLLKQADQLFSALRRVKLAMPVVTEDPFWFYIFCGADFSEAGLS